MNAQKDYTIPFVGLKNGIHEFQFEITDSFFADFETSEVHSGKVIIDLKFDKRDGFFILNFNLGGTVHTECDRCTREIDLEILDEYQVYVKFDEEAKRNGEWEQDVIYISHNDTHLELAQLIYEFIHLSVPMKKICPPDKNGNDGCDPEVLKKLEEQRKNEDDSDPRWSALRSLK